jgi:NAD-specific glutamate dehydrogenase
MEPQNQTDSWHLDKKVPLALILAMAVQTVGVIWWAASLSTRVDHQERQIAGLVLSEQQTKQEARRIGEWLSRVDERIAAQTEMLRRLEATLTRSHPTQGGR